MAETDANGNITKYYVYGAQGELLSMVDPSGSQYYYHYDHIGNTLALTDINGSVVNSYAYEPFGRLAGQGETVSNPFKYVGRWGIMEEGNNLYYMRARYYDSSLGRFITRDPIGLLGGVNLYGYVGNNPVNWVDPLGLAPGDWWDARTYGPDLEGATRIANEVRYIEAPATDLPGAHNGPQDAWRHARWNQRIVEEIGWGTAIIAGYGHELGQLFSQPWNELLMDLHNNREGRRIANTGKTPGDLVNEGRLRTINPPCKGKGGSY